jgi:hypothetical protein
MNDDKLILYYYDDGLSARERREIEAALAEDTKLAARYADLCRDLDGFAEEPVDVPAHVVQRMHDSIDRVARPVLVSQEPRRSFNPLSFVWGAAVTAALAIGIGIGVYLSAPPTATPVQVAGDPFTRGMQVYLQDARADLVSMPVGSVQERTDLIMHIVEQNRLFEQAAVQNDSQNLARVLRAFEPILLQLATEDLAPDQAEALRAQLAFELNVMLTKLSRVSSNETQTT